MPIYTLYIEDDRYRVPTLLTEELVDDTKALAYATRLFTQSPRYMSIEVWDGDRRVIVRPRPGAQDAGSL